MHHLHALRALELGVLASNLDLAFRAVRLEGGLVPFLRVLLLANVQDLQRLLDSACHFVSLELAIGVIFEEHFIVAVVLVLFCLFLALFDPLANLFLRGFFICEGLLLFVCMAWRVLIFCSSRSSRSASSLSSLLRASSRSLFSSFSRCVIEGLPGTPPFFRFIGRATACSRPTTAAAAPSPASAPSPSRVFPAPCVGRSLLLVGRPAHQSIIAGKNKWNNHEYVSLAGRLRR